MARALIGQGRVDEAREELNEALPIDPGNAQAASMLLEIR